MELQYLGWNILTLGFIGTLVLTILEGYGSWVQSRAIWLNRSGQSVSITVFTFLLFEFIVTFTYGVSINSIALIFNGLLVVMQIPIVLGLWKFKGFNKKEKALSLALCLVCIVMIFSSAKDWFFLLFSLGSIAFFLPQPWEIWKNKDSGVVEIKMIAAYFISALFWTLYAYAIHDWVLEIVCPSYLILLVLAGSLWYKYRQPL